MASLWCMFSRQVFSHYADKNVPAATVQLRTLRTAQDPAAGKDGAEVSRVACAL